MENRMRDLEQIQERSSGGRGHPIGSVLLAVLTVLGFTFAMGVVVGRAANPEDERVEDPLSRLDRKDGLRARAEPEREAVPEIRREELTFPTVLTDHDDRPEVEAVLEAAAAEEADLEAAALPPEPSATEEAEPEQPRSPASVQKIAEVLPAAVAAGKAVNSLARAAEERDPLLSAAINEPASAQSAPPGRDGAFTLQVASYDQPGAAQAFVKGLRARGHQAFVTSADIPGRGRFWRVRVGPFDSKWEADAYREKFEEQERMNTFVVRRRD